MERLLGNGAARVGRAAIAALAALLAALATAATASAAPTFVSSTFTTHGTTLYYEGETLEMGIAAGPDGAMWVTEPEGPAFARVAPDETISEYVEPDGVEAPAEPHAIVAGADGGLWFTEPDQNALGRFDPVTHEAEVIAPGTHGLSADAEPEQIVAGPDGNLWFTELNRHAIGKVVPAHGPTEAHVTEYETGITGNTVAITSAADGLWFTEITANGGTIARIDTGGAVGPAYGNVLPTSNAEAPTYITAGPDGNLWFVNGYFKGYVGRITPAGAETRFTEGVDPNSFETAPVAGSDGNIWLLESNRSKLLEVTPAGHVNSYTPPESAHFFSPLRGPMALGPDGDLWEISQFGEVVRIDIGADGSPPAEEHGTPGGPGGPPSAGTPAPTPKPGPKHLKCRKGFRKKTVHGKPRCVKAKHKHRKHRH